MRDWRVFPTPLELAAGAVELIAAEVEAARAARGRALIALSGGKSPLPLFEALASKPGVLPWESIDLYWTDERCVPASDPRSNFGTAKRLLLDRLATPGPRVHAISGDGDPAASAAEYGRALRDLAPDGLDLLILGVGDDGHTAGLFPGQPALEERKHRAVAVSRPDGLRGVTMTFPFLNRSRSTLIIATGAGKRGLLSRLAEEPPPDWPITRLAPPKPPLWLVDRDAAGA